ncbi:PilW family protein [Alcanivorax sp. NBRC 102024]|uniref:PilW family protein n=1 Tax=Alcanivorax sp. NBRC 102024 TaxID=1113895 RepID=UPI000789FD5D|nr:PilW family protein [Alcanivorax sp. NBRC 102024]
MKAAQRGFSLVELMVAMVLGLIVTLAAVQIFTANLRSSETQKVMTEVQESGRYAIQMLSSDLRRAGTPMSDHSLASPGSGYITDPIIFGPDLSREGGGNADANDSVAFQFYGVQDCEGDRAAGASLDSPVLITNVYDVRMNADSGANELFCEGDVDLATRGAAMIAGIDSFQVLYGVDRPTIAGENRIDRVAFAGQYVDADNVVGETVVSVRVGLLVSAEVDNLPDFNEGQRFVVLDKELVNGEGPLAEVKMRRLFVTTVKLRNLSQRGVTPDDLIL